MSQKHNKIALNAQNLSALLKATSSGVIKQQFLHLHWRDVQRAIREAKGKNKVGVHNQVVYDAERYTKENVIELLQTGELELALPNFAAMAATVLQNAPKPALLAREIEKEIGAYFSMSLVMDEALETAGIIHLELSLMQPYGDWYISQTVDYETAYEYAFAEAEKRHSEAWAEILEWAGDELRTGATDGGTARSRALARLYSRSQLEATVSISERVIRLATRDGNLPRRQCPDGAKRMRAMDVHRLRDDKAFLQKMEDEIEINIWQIRAITDLKISFLRTFLQKEGVKTVGHTNRDDPFASVWYLWGDVRRVLWNEGGHPSLRDIELIEETNGAGREDWWSERISEIHREMAEQKRRQREAKAELRRQEREQREALRTQMLDNFPSWVRDDDVEQMATIHVGPTNSGKTHDAIQELSQARSGWYLAPLRLLAREWFERMNQMGVVCNLLTGEERIDIPGAWMTAATIEMFNPDSPAECVVVDEAHMLADDQRGWAWTRAIVNTSSSNLQIITAPHGLSLISKFLDSMGVEKQIVHHKRLVPLEVAPLPWELDALPPRTIVIAFTRRDVLQLKYVLQRMGRSVSVVYGALPPEVRLKQAHRFAYGEADLCVATDAVGMGLNLPADNVVFTDMMKFDGRNLRRLRPSELQQIAGRAGRFGLSQHGMVGATDKHMLDMVRAMMAQNIPDEKYARLAPRTDEIALLEGDLVQRLTIWQQLNAVPDVLRSIVKSTELEDRLELAQFLSYGDLMNLGVEAALILVSAPVRKESREYWMDCATAIINNQPLPYPPPPPAAIHEGKSLKDAEMVISCMDVYLWLGYRQPFRHLVEGQESIVAQRDHLTREIDLALLRKFDPNTRGPRRRLSDSWYDE